MTNPIQPRSLATPTSEQDDKGRYLGQTRKEELMIEPAPPQGECPQCYAINNSGGICWRCGHNLSTPNRNEVKPCSMTTTTAVAAIAKVSAAPPSDPGDAATPKTDALANALLNDGWSIKGPVGAALLLSRQFEFDLREQIRDAATIAMENAKLRRELDRLELELAQATEYKARFTELAEYLELNLNKDDPQTASRCIDHIKAAIPPSWQQVKGGPNAPHCDRDTRMIDAATTDLRAQLDQCRKALEAVPLFYSIVWSSEQAAKWLELTGVSEATTKVLCDTVRAALAVTNPTKKD